MGREFARYATDVYFTVVPANICECYVAATLLQFTLLRLCDLPGYAWRLRNLRRVLKENCFG